jgi:predicted HicB family RNase H-like nuclease
MMTYKGYAGQIDYDSKAGVFGGSVVNANVLISFEGRDAAELRDSFKNVVDLYLAECKAAGRAPERPYNGTIIVRVGPDLHRRVALKAAATRLSMNKYVASLIERATKETGAGLEAGGPLATRAKRASKSRFRKALKKVSS